MNHFNLRPTAFLLSFSLLLTLFVPVPGLSQKHPPSSAQVRIVVSGTSNVHDWDIKSDKGVCTSVFAVNSVGNLLGMSQLSFTIPAESLKSEHRGMDKNTYKALNTSKYHSIEFTAGSVDVKSAGKEKYMLVSKGKLTIAGVSKDIVLTATGSLNADNTISYSGSYNLVLTDYKVEPPTALLGTIKTGDKVVVKYDLVLKSM